MKISRMNKVQDFGKLKAFFDLELDVGITIKGFKIMESMNGLFVSMPSQQKNGEWYNTIFCTKEIVGQINQIALDYYNQEASTGISAPQKRTNTDDIPF